MKLRVEIPNLDTLYHVMLIKFRKTEFRTFNVKACNSIFQLKGFYLQIFQFLMAATCLSCRINPTLISIIAMLIKIRKFRIFDQARVLKRGVVTF